MLIRIQHSYREIVAICDTDLLGKRFEEGKFQLDVKESFFKGDEKNKEETIKIIQDLAKEDATFYIIGEESTQTALEAGLITEEGIKKIDGVPFALVLL